jgi:hypothetical protein
VRSRLTAAIVRVTAAFLAARVDFDQGQLLVFAVAEA